MLCMHTSASVHGKLTFFWVILRDRVWSSLTEPNHFLRVGCCETMCDHTLLLQLWYCLYVQLYNNYGLKSLLSKHFYNIPVLSVSSYQIPSQPHKENASNLIVYSTELGWRVILGQCKRSIFYLVAGPKNLRSVCYYTDARLLPLENLTRETLGRLDC